MAQDSAILIISLIANGGWRTIRVPQLSWAIILLAQRKIRKRIWNGWRIAHYFVRWDQLRRLGEARAAKITAYFPLVVLFAYHSPRLEAVWHRLFENAPPLFYSNEFRLLVMGLIVFSFGEILFRLLCPNVVREHGDDTEYLIHTGPAVWQGQAVPEPEPSVRKIVNLYAPDYRDWRNKTKTIRYYYRGQSLTLFPFRITIGVCFLIGLFYISLPTGCRTWAVVRAFQAECSGHKCLATYSGLNPCNNLLPSIDIFGVTISSQSRDSTWQTSR